MDWTLSIAFHFPHNRFLAGWEYISADNEYKYTTVNVYLLIATLTLDF